jgi:hypothetical protein
LNAAMRSSVDVAVDVAAVTTGTLPAKAGVPGL